MLGMIPPSLSEVVVPVLTDGQIEALFDSCQGKDFVNRRDMAIIRVFLASGLRLAEMGGLHTERCATVWEDLPMGDHENPSDGDGKKGDGKPGKLKPFPAPKDGKHSKGGKGKK